MTKTMWILLTLLSILIICTILIFSKIYSKENDILNNKIIFKINNDVYTSIDFKNRKEMDFDDCEGTKPT